MSARRRTHRGALGAAVGLAALVAAVVPACSDDDEQPTVTLPSSLVVPTAPTTTDGPAPTTSTTSAPITPDTPPRISGVRAELASTTCTDGTVAATVTVGLEAQPPVRVVTVFVDGSTTMAANAAPDGATVTLTAPGLPCDGAVHTLLVIATGENRQSGTTSASVRTPRSPSDPSASTS